MNLRKLGSPLLQFALCALLFAASTTYAQDDRAADRAAIKAPIESIFQAFINRDATKLRATHEGQKSAEQLKTSLELHRHEFDYLLGDWEFTAVNRDGGFRGRWTAVRLPETGQIMDEFRIVSNSGDTLFVSTTLRAYNAVLNRWELVSMDNRGTGLQNFGTAHQDGKEMLIEQTFGSGTPTAWTSRIRYYNILPNQFSWISDRSLDGGKTWVKDFQRIEARRIGAPRSLEPLTPSKQ
jgi:hypothetical protein